MVPVSLSTANRCFFVSAKKREKNATGLLCCDSVAANACSEASTWLERIYKYRSLKIRFVLGQWKNFNLG